MPTDDLHYWGYAGKPEVGIPCGAPRTTGGEDARVTSYAQSVTCPGCLEVLGAQLSEAVSPVTYFPPVWVLNRTIVRKKGTDGPDLVLYRMRLSSSRETSKISLLPVEACSNLYQHKAGDYPDSVTLSISDVEDNYEPTGKVMSVLRAPL